MRLAAVLRGAGGSALAGRKMRPADERRADGGHADLTIFVTVTLRDMAGVTLGGRVCYEPLVSTHPDTQGCIVLVTWHT